MSDTVDDGLVQDLENRAEFAEARASELEAQCAAMREALVHALADFHHLETKHGAYTDCTGIAVKRATKALASDAGKAVLERLAKAERERDGFWKAAKYLEGARAQAFEEAAQVAEAQAYYPDTHTGMRQQWVKNQIAAAIRTKAKEGT